MLYYLSIMTTVANSKIKPSFSKIKTSFQFPPRLIILCFSWLTSDSLWLTEEHEESVYNTFISEIRNFRMRLEGHEEQLIRQIRTPLDRDDVQQSILRIAEQEVQYSSLRNLSVRYAQYRNLSFFCLLPS